MSSQYHSLKHPRKISDITEGEIALYGSPDGFVWYPIKVDTDGRLSVVSGLVPKSYDYIVLSYTGSNITGVVYKINGSGGTIVATLALTYNANGNIETITRT